MKLKIERSYTLLRDGKEIVLSLKDILSASPKTLIYFYPKDNTPGCTMESKDFTCLQAEFRKLGIQIVGVSKDTIDAHKHFVTSENLGVDLISDTDGKLHAEFDVIGEKNMYGKISIGVIRSTFLVDGDGNILHQWRNVKATGHAEKILKALK